MEEKELFEEIKPLIEEYKEYANQETPEVFKWNDSRASSVSRVQNKSNVTDREGEILEILDEEKTINNRRVLIEELVEIREAKKEEMRSTIFEKVGAFVNDEKERMNKEIEERRQELEDEKEEKRKELKERLEKKQQELEEKKQRQDEIHKKSKAYQDETIIIKGNKMLEEGYRFFLDKSKEINNNLYELNKDVNALKKECEALKFEYEDFTIEDDEELKEAEKRLNDFEETYGKIDFTSEDAIDYIGEIVENYKEDEIHKLTEEEVEVEEPDKVITMEDIENDGEDSKVEPKVVEGDTIGKEEIKRQDREIADMAKSMGNGGILSTSEINRVLEAMEREEKTTGAKPEVVGENKTKEQGKATAQREKVAKQTGTKQPETKQSGVEAQTIMKGSKVYDKYGKEVNATVQEYMDMSYKQTLKEEREQRLAEIKAGFEDIVEADPYYIGLENNLRSYENIADIEWVLKSLEGKHILDMYDGMPAKADSPEERAYIENIINQITERAEREDLSNLVNEIENRKKLHSFANEYANLHTDYMLQIIDKEGYSKNTQELMHQYGDNIESIKRMMECYKKLRDIGNIEPETEEEKANWLEEMNIIDEEYKDVKDVAVELLDMENDLINSKQTEMEQQEPTKSIANISIGKELKITFEGQNNYTKIISFKDIKLNLSMTNEEKSKAIALIKGNELSWKGKENILARIDPNFLDALLVAKEEGITKEELSGVCNTYISALMGNKECKSSIKDILTYDRTGLDLKKPSNIFQMLIRNKEYRKMEKYAMEANFNQMAKIEKDKNGFIRNILNKMKPPKMIGGKNADEYIERLCRAGQAKVNGESLNQKIHAEVNEEQAMEDANKKAEVAQQEVERS